MHIAFSLHAQVQKIFPGEGDIYGFQGQELVMRVYLRPTCIFDNFTI